jgi:hypothetical protein
MVHSQNHSCAFMADYYLARFEKLAATLNLRQIQTAGKCPAGSSLGRNQGCLPTLRLVLPSTARDARWSASRALGGIGPGPNVADAGFSGNAQTDDDSLTPILKILITQMKGLPSRRLLRPSESYR